MKEWMEGIIANLKRSDVEGYLTPEAQLQRTVQQELAKNPYLPEGEGQEITLWNFNEQAEDNTGDN